MVPHKNIIPIGLLAMIILCWSADRSYALNDTIKVGLYANEPKIYIDQDGKPAGIFIDLLNQISKEEGWQVKYIETDWDDGLYLLKQGEIDLMPDVAFSINRNQLFDFNTVPVIESWSQIYAAPETSIIKLSDLIEKRIAVLSGAIQENEFQTLMNGFDYPYTKITARSYQHAFKLVQTDSADAVVCNHFFGDTHFQQYNLNKTPVIFNPAMLHFATAKGTNSQILHTIDQYLTSWQKTPNSFYYKTLRLYLEKPILQPYQYPWWTVITIAGLFLLALVIIVILRIIIHQKTKDIHAVNQKLNQEKNKFQSYFELAPLGIFVVNEQGDFLEGNKKAEEITGYPIKEIKNKNIERLIPSNQVKKTLREIEIIFKQEKLSKNFQIITKNQNLRTVSVNSVKLFENRYLVFIKDITDLKKTEEKIKHSERIFNHAADMLAIAGFDGYLKVLNPAWKKTLGWSVEELKAKPWSNFLHPEDVDATNHILTKIIEGNQVIRFKNRYITKTGTYKWLEWKAYPYPEEKIMVSVARDVTEDEKMEQALRESEERYRSVINSSMDAVLLTSPDGGIFSANKAACDLFKMTEEEICNAGRKGIIDINDPRLPAMLDERKKTGKTKGELTLKRKDQTTFQAEVSTSVFYNSKGEERTSMFIRDITARKKAEQALKSFQENLETQVHEKTKELSERINELEHFREVTIEREIRMEELRKEIEHLKQKLNHDKT
ncbi:MAG: PAS domain S-box protein [Bacteroidales bacterium]|jgi:PAS domain S-box-containing protein|nr:PAS domain S-box protein [Bacteroidales bacterium]